MSKRAKPQSGPGELPPTTPPKTPKTEGAKVKPSAKKEKSNFLKGSKYEALGLLLMKDLEKIANIFGKFYSRVINFDYNKYIGIKAPQEKKKALTKLEEQIKLPKIENADELKSNTEEAKPGDSLSAYLYRALNIPLPKLSEVKPKTDKIQLPHLTKQLKDSGVAPYEGKNAIMSRMNKKPSKYRVGDLVVLRGTNGKFTAGLVMAINDKEVVFRNNELSPVKRSTDELFLAYHFNGNTKEIPKA